MMVDDYDDDDDDMAMVIVVSIALIACKSRLLPVHVCIDVIYCEYNCGHVYDLGVLRRQRVNRQSGNIISSGQKLSHMKLGSLRVLERTGNTVLAGTARRISYPAVIMFRIFAE